MPPDRATFWLCLTAQESAPETQTSLASSSWICPRGLQRTRNKSRSRKTLLRSPWWRMIQTNQIPLQDVQSALSRIYAFDCFVHNHDRHAGNFLVVPQRSGHAVLAFDYSRAWIYHGFPLPSLPFAATEKTLAMQRQLKAIIGDYINPAQARQVLETLRKVPVTQVEKIISNHPQDWLDKNIRDQICSWWTSKEMGDRLDEIAAGIDNGTYL